MLKKLSQMKTQHQVLFAVIIAFAVISFWRGIWGLMDIYLFPEHLPLSFSISFLLGLVILVATHYAAKELM
jgi:hypothetical protein